jgi:hypothetical protein
MNQITFTLDGKVIDVSGYKTKTAVFNYTANADLPNCTGDPCFDGQQHTVAMSGYWVILRPLSAGTHTIRTTGGTTLDPRVKDVTWTITQQ